MTPRKRKRDGDITDYFPVTPKTPRTRDVREEGTESDDDIYELSDREASPSGRHRGRCSQPMLIQATGKLSIHTDSSPTPLPRRSNAPSRSLGPPSPPSSWEEALREAAVQSAVPVPPPPAPLAYPPSGAYSVLNTLLSAPVVIASNTAPQVPVQAPPPALVPSYAAPRSNTPPPTLRPENALAPSPAFQPRTPRSNNRGRAMHDMPPPNPPTPGSGRRRLSAQELETYNVVIRALTGANVKLSGKGQKALRDIIKEEDFWIGS